MAKVLGVYNCKGGSTKTFTVLSLAVGLANKGRKVLVIDNDPQGNTSYKFFIDYENMKGLNDVIMNQCSIEDVIYHTKVDNIDLVPGNMDLEILGIPMLNAKSDREFLKRQISKIKDRYDYILFDNNPSYHIFLYNLVFCCDWILIPINVDKNSSKGVDMTVDRIVETINSTSADVNVEFKILITKLARTKRSLEFCNAVKDKWEDLVLDTVIRLQSNPADMQTTEDDYFAVNNALPHRDPEEVTDPETGEKKIIRYKTNLGTDYLDLVDEIEKKLEIRGK